MDIKWIKTFVIAAEYENFRKASEQLYLTQPGVTKHIKRLESELGIPLFERNGKHVSLTNAGEKFLSIAKGLINTFEEGMEEFEGWKQGYNRKLVIAVAPQIAASMLPSLLRSFIDENPTIEVIINVTKSFEIGETVDSGKADIGLSRMEPIQHNVYSKVIHRDPVIMVASYKEENQDDSELLKRYRLLTNNHPTYWEELLSEIKSVYPKVRTLPVTQIEITKQLIEIGLGVSYLPFSMVQSELKNKKLVEIKQTNIQLPFSLTYVVTKKETEEVKTFMTFINEAFS
ncbi:LysR family transcriptional regulator [Bacillus sp. 03113]|uniref:LysR family transcriptional regulator n=1 Tax=Bacillus sp. 03113 TaxID=2578211 RepID=UPI0011439586|nr:LysR family transcriptional regulator [Bacillus sp. 03113]